MGDVGNLGCAGRPPAALGARLRAGLRKLQAADDPESYEMQVSKYQRVLVPDCCRLELRRF